MFPGFPYPRFALFNTWMRTYWRQIVIIAFVLAIPLCANQAHGATPNQIEAVIAKIQTKTIEITGILADTNDGTLYKVGVRTLSMPSCGKGASVGVSTISIMPMDGNGQTADITSINIIVPYEITGGKLMLFDLNADGKSDSVAPIGTITNEVAQPIFDQIIACVAKSQ